MDNSVIFTILGFIIAFLGGIFFNRKSTQTDAKILDLTGKIKQKQEEADKKQADADNKLKEYLDALKKYDPDFDGDDDPSGHSA